jgi:Protein of unknown function (DUF3363)
LGPETDLELRKKLLAEVLAERFTRIDRAMLEEAPDRVLDLQPEAGQIRADFDRTLRIGRLQTLERYGLAKGAEPGVWVVSEKLEPTLRELGERGDIIKAINCALTERGERQEIERVGKSLEGQSRLPFRIANEGERITGVFTRTTQLASGTYALIENTQEFTLVPWRPLMDERLGRQISGVVLASGVSWDFDRKRGLGIGM